MKAATSYKTNQFVQIGKRLENPFPGLRPFGIDEAHLFFGREGQSDDILLKLAQNRFAALLGFSGSGKSSLIYCGLIPVLHGGFMTEAGADWKVVVMRPGTSPIDNLAESLVSTDESYASLSTEEKAIRKTVLSTILRSSSLGLIEAVKRLRSSSQQNILVLVDQFEEIFRYKKLETQNTQSDESAIFVSLLVEAVRRQQEPVYVALTMRSDFIGECAVFPELTQMINDSHYLIPQMNREQKRMAIEGPVAVGGGKIAPRLVQQLLNDVGESPDQLPILQHSMMRTWQYWQVHRKGDEPIDIQQYNAIGTLKEALSQHANEAYDSLNSREKKICEVMFKSLTERGAEGKEVRRPTKLGVMAAIAGVNEDDMMRVVDRFREPGRTLLMPPHEVELQGDTVVDISHESLMRIWTRLNGWVDEESRSAEMYLKLSEASERYQRGEAGLWVMPDLQLALNWKQENTPTLVWGKRYHPAYERAMVFLDTSRRSHETEQRNKELLQRKKVRNNRILALVGATVALVCIFLAYLSFTKAEEAARQQEAATRAATAAQQEKLRADEQRDAAVLAQKEAEEAKNRAEQAKQEALLQKAEAERQKEIAEVQKKRAEEALIQAEEARKQADANAEQARRSAEKAAREAARADRLRYQAIAQSMAAKVDDIRDPEQKNLTAMQAYLFYEKYGDRLYNADIYEGVYNAYKANLGDSANYFNVHKGNIRTVAFTKDVNTAFSGSSDGKIYSWDLSEGIPSPALIYDISKKNAIFRVLIPMANGARLLATGEATQAIHIINAKNGGIIKKMPAPSESIYDLEILPNEKEYISVGEDRYIYKGNFAQAGVFKILGRSEEKIRSIDISPDGSTLATADDLGNIFLWDLKRNTKRLLYEKGSPIHAIRFSYSGKLLAFADETGELILWDTENELPYTNLSAHYSRVSDIRFSQDDKLMVTTSFDHTAKIWDLENINDLPIVLKDHSSWVWAAAFSPDNQYVITGGGDRVLRIYPTLAKDMVAEFCENAQRNMSSKEWARFVAEDIPYQITCGKYPVGEEVDQKSIRENTVEEELDQTVIEKDNLQEDIKKETDIDKEE